MADGRVKSCQEWSTNGHLIADVAKVGYLRKRTTILDCTFGLGTFWKQWSPTESMFVGCDLDPRLSPCGEPVDFRKMPFLSRSFRVVVFDPPYKLNGTPDEDVDERYGVHVPQRWQDRMKLCRRGLDECCRVSDDLILMKCQDQVCSGKLRSQTIEFTNHAATHGFGLRDRFDMISYRDQPKGVRQVHAAHNLSTLLILKRGWITSDV